MIPHRYQSVLHTTTMTSTHLTRIPNHALLHVSVECRGDVMDARKGEAVAVVCTHLLHALGDRGRDHQRDETSDAAVVSVHGKLHLSESRAELNGRCATSPVACHLSPSQKTFRRPRPYGLGFPLPSVGSARHVEQPTHYPLVAPATRRQRLTRCQPAAPKAPSRLYIIHCAVTP
jgi:hypothetical protein